MLSDDPHAPRGGQTLPYLHSAFFGSSLDASAPAGDAFARASGTRSLNRRTDVAGPWDEPPAQSTPGTRAFPLMVVTDRPVTRTFYDGREGSLLRGGKKRYRGARPRRRRHPEEVRREREARRAATADAAVRGRGATPGGMDGVVVGDARLSALGRKKQRALAVRAARSGGTIEDELAYEQQMEELQRRQFDELMRKIGGGARSAPPPAPQRVKGATEEQRAASRAAALAAAAAEQTRETMTTLTPSVRSKLRPDTDTPGGGEFVNVAGSLPSPAPPGPLRRQELSVESRQSAYGDGADGGSAGGSAGGEQGRHGGGSLEEEEAQSRFNSALSAGEVEGGRSYERSPRGHSSSLEGRSIPQPGFAVMDADGDEADAAAADFRRSMRVQSQRAARELDRLRFKEEKQRIAQELMLRRRAEEEAQRKRIAGLRYHHAVQSQTKRALTAAHREARIRFLARAEEKHREALQSGSQREKQQEREAREFVTRHKMLRQQAKAEAAERQRLLRASRPPASPGGVAGWGASTSASAASPVGDGPLQQPEQQQLRQQQQLEPVGAPRGSGELQLATPPASPPRGAGGGSRAASPQSLTSSVAALPGARQSRAPAHTAAAGRSPPPVPQPPPEVDHLTPEERAAMAATGMFVPAAAGDKLQTYLYPRVLPAARAKPMLRRAGDNAGRGADGAGVAVSRTQAPHMRAFAEGAGYGQTFFAEQVLARDVAADPEAAREVMAEAAAPLVVQSAPSPSLDPQGLAHVAPHTPAVLGGIAGTSPGIDPFTGRAATDANPIYKLDPFPDQVAEAERAFQAKQQARTGASPDGSAFASAPPTPDPTRVDTAAGMHPGRTPPQVQVQAQQQQQRAEGRGSARASVRASPSPSPSRGDGGSPNPARWGGSRPNSAGHGGGGGARDDGVAELDISQAIAIAGGPSAVSLAAVAGDEAPLTAEAGAGEARAAGE